MDHVPAEARGREDSSRQGWREAAILARVIAHDLQKSRYAFPDPAHIGSAPHLRKIKFARFQEGHRIRNIAYAKVEVPVHPLKRGDDDALLRGRYQKGKASHGLRDAPRN